MRAKSKSLVTQETILIKRARQRTGLNQSDFGSFMGMQISSISRYERGAKKSSIDFIQRCKNIIATPQEQLNIYISEWKAKQAELLKAVI